MKFEIYDETKKPEPVCRVKLIKTSYCSGSVTLVAVDEHGVALPQGEILSLYFIDGGFHRHSCCNVPGIRTDIDGKIIEGTE